MPFDKAISKKITKNKVLSLIDDTKSTKDAMNTVIKETLQEALKSVQNNLTFFIVNESELLKTNFN